ncbi:hypothetical protein DFH06DRAFT_1338706 [Mycena polygramma]|nr:hypothetical protein DFH06DRAFT_1338706 [Mycena polygramma]
MPDVDSTPDSATQAESMLPLDLEREIFRTASARHPDVIPTLLLVCHRVHAWVEPLLYRVFSFRDNSIRFAAQSKSAEFLRAAVRHVFFDRGFDLWDTKKDLLLKFTGATNIYVYSYIDLPLLLVLDNMRPEKLSFVFNINTEPPLSTLQRPLFRSVTHLDLYFELGLFQQGEVQGRWCNFACFVHRENPWNRPGNVNDKLLPPVWQEWSHLASLPAISHLCLSARFHNDVLPRALAECPWISVVVAAFRSSYEWVAVIEFTRSNTIRDQRFVVMVIPDSEADWKIGARGGADFWVRAEEFISRKRRGEIKEDCYFEGI